MHAVSRTTIRTKLPNTRLTNYSTRNRDLPSDYSSGEESPERDEGKGRKSCKGGSNVQAGMKKKKEKDLSIVIESFDEQMPEVQKYKQKHPMFPNKNFRMLIIGGSGCGKTTLLLNMLMRYIHWDRIYVYAKTVGDDQDKYVILEDFVRALEEKVAEEAEEVTIGTFSNKLSDLVNVDDLDPKKQNLIIFDDIVLDKDQSGIMEHMIRGRKKNCSYIYLTQSYFKVPKCIRLNMTQFVLFRIESQKELRAIADDHASRLSYDDFIVTYRAAVEESGPYSFLYIDSEAPNIYEYIRKGFTEVYWPESNNNEKSNSRRVRR